MNRPWFKKTTTHIFAVSTVVVAGLYLILKSNQSVSLGLPEDQPQHRLLTTPERVNAWLAEFNANPKKQMDSLPPKGILHGPNGTDWSFRQWFDKSEVDAGEFVLQKSELRAKSLIGSTPKLLAPIQSDDLAEDLVDQPSRMLKSLKDMDQRQLLNAKLAQRPWSDDYWPTYMGGIAARYADENFPNSDNWLENHNYVIAPQSSFAAIGEGADAGSIKTLSPAEKYDLIVGSKEGALSASVWKSGEEVYNESGEVERWMGICHGWSVAAYNVARPKKTVNATAVNGSTVPFFVSDIKGLVSHLWANAGVRTKFIGGRCNDKNPPKDGNGRTIRQQCFDTNPGTWHLVVVNQLALARRSFVLDATFDYQVWNQPAVAYEYTYFNPQTMKAAATLTEATVDKSAFTADKFKKYRTRDFKSVVGITMNLSYVAETGPSHADSNSELQDAVRTVSYVYDVELDAEGKIVGGEWYQNRHPDFLWGVAPGTQATTWGDIQLGRSSTSWNLSQPMPVAWQKAAIENAQQGLPLAKVLSALVQAAQ